MKCPDIQSIKQIALLSKDIFFPGYFEPCPTEEHLLENYLTVRKQQLRLVLCDQIAVEQADAFLAELPEIGRLLNTDVDAMIANDPAAVDNRDEVIYCYPFIQAIINYRVAHCLHRLGVKIIPRILTERAHTLTGIDIHPGAQIGEYFAIDHGTGVVIGETCIIGSHVTLYQGVTLGAKNFQTDEHGNMINQPRHPILEDYVTVYSNATLLGRITLGHHSVIGGNQWLTHSVPPHSRVIVNNPAQQ